MAIYWPTLGFNGRTFKLCVLTRWDFNFCVCGSRLRDWTRKHKIKQVTLLTFTDNWCRFPCWGPWNINRFQNMLLFFWVCILNSSVGSCGCRNSSPIWWRTQSLNGLSLKPGVGQYVVIHATLTARDFFLAYFYPSSPFTCIFSKTSPNFFLCWPAE